MASRLLIRLALALAGVVVALLLAEGTLRLTHPRYAGAAAVQWVDDLDLGYHRQPGHRRQHAHPDTGQRHWVLHNSLGLRMHREVKLPPPPGVEVHAFFGDSFTENLNLPVTLNFSEALHYLRNQSGRQAEVLNFGVDGYGPGQELLSFRRFLQAHPGTRLDHVYYVHCGNDLRNLHEARLFSLGPEGRLLRRRLRQPGLALRLGRRLYLTYFMVERGILDRDQLRRAFTGGAGPLFQDGHGAVMDPRFTHERKRLREVLKPAMAQKTRQMLDGELAETDPAARLFYAVIRAWRQEVEAQGGAFHIVLLPDNGLRGLAKQLSAEFSVLSTVSAFLIDEPNHYIEQEMYFKKDAHWNGLGNLLTADALNRWIDLKFARPPELRDPRVDPALGPWTAAAAPHLLDRMFAPEQATRFKKIPRAELDRILAPYVSLEPKR